MVVDKGDRTVHFGAIEKKHGQPAAYWLKLLSELESTKYQDQIDFLREGHGFSQTHANALVMYSRGSTTSRRFSEPDAYFQKLTPQQAKTAREIFATIQKKYPKLVLVTAWNKPMLKLGDAYVFGLSVSKNHILLAPFGTDIVRQVEALTQGLTVNKKTIQVPLDWRINARLLSALIEARLKELK
ncbi:MAG: DUF4287 domain-containing protein [Acidobacteria bacterium]|nr:DUF4287 domain-containing protein [Acidobacteriota bacterium]